MSLPGPHRRHAAPLATDRAREIRQALVEYLSTHGPSTVEACTKHLRCTGQALERVVGDSPRTLEYGRSRHRRRIVQLRDLDAALRSAETTDLIARRRAERVLALRREGIA